MIPAEFEYSAPTSLQEASSLLASSANAKLLAGGMSLIPALKHRLTQPGLLIDLGRVPDLEDLSERRGRVTCGARVTHGALLDEDLAHDFPVLAETAAVIGDVQVRNRGTLGGSLVHADPAADWPALFLALDGEADLLGPEGKRTVAARDFFVSMLASATRPNEILTEVRLPFERKRAGSAYVKMRQAASGFAIVGVAAQVVLDRSERCERVNVAITGVNAVPFRAASLEAKLMGQTLDGTDLTSLCRGIEELDPMEDLHASSDYRRHLAAVFASRALLKANQRARA